MIEWILSLSTEEKVIYGITVPIIVGTIIALINQRLNHSFAIRRDRRKALVEAAAKLRVAIDFARIESFSEYHLLDVLDRGLVPGDGEKFEGEFFKHKRAVHEYRIYLPWFDRFRFNRAWKKYHGGDK